MHAGAGVRWRVPDIRGLTGPRSAVQAAGDSVSGSSADSRVRSYVELVAIGLGWLTWVASRGLSAYMWRRGDIDLMPVLGRAALLGILFTIFLFEALHLVTRRRLVTPVTLVSAVVVTLVFAYVNDVANTTFARLRAGLWPVFLSPLHRDYLSGTMNWYIVFAGLTLLFFLMGIWWELEDERKRALQSAMLAREARLQTLRYQLNPEFLFSALGSLREVMVEDRTRADRLVTDLSAFLRSSLVEEDRLEVKLGRELETIRNYLSIQQMRLRDRLQVSIRADDAARERTVPAFVVQTLVENAVKHGLRTSPARLRVSLDASVMDGVLRIDVANTGRLAGAEGAPGEVGPAAAGGLRNVRLHLEHCYPGRHEFQLAGRAGVVHATVMIEPEHAPVA